MTIQPTAAFINLFRTNKLTLKEFITKLSYPDSRGEVLAKYPRDPIPMPSIDTTDRVMGTRQVNSQSSHDQEQHRREHQRSLFAKLSSGHISIEQVVNELDLKPTPRQYALLQALENGANMGFRDVCRTFSEDVFEKKHNSVERCRPDRFGPPPGRNIIQWDV